ncbi:MAG: family 10 glycosylhydrolase [Lachnospiraceae bacterium]|nr:family 10 glycosylhydrolase [Lachnospiraceae bacterium]
MRNRISVMILLLLCCIFVSGSLQAQAREAGGAEQIPMRGVWVGTVNHIDYPSIPTKDSKILKREIDTVIKNCKAEGFNAIFLQVRPDSDAIYPSEVYPWSAYLTGVQGLAPIDGFDPLAYWVQQAHANEMQLHAWINPYRITTNGVEEWNALSQQNPAKLHPDWVIQYSNQNFYYNPALPEVRALIEAGVMEIVHNYDVDGIHMDDYFYPGKDFPDQAYYMALNQGQFSTIEDWRRNNVNILIQEIDQQVHEVRADIQWGISPSGVWENQSANPLGSDTQGGNPSYSKLYADTRLWALSGWIDYIAPQIYWNIGHDKADYTKLVNWWSDTLKDSPTKLYIGLADYKAYQVKPGNVWYGGTELCRQMKLNQDNEKVAGEIHFRYQLIMSDPMIKRVISDTYTKEK